MRRDSDSSNLFPKLQSMFQNLRRSAPPELEADLAAAADHVKKSVEALRGVDVSDPAQFRKAFAALMALSSSTVSEAVARLERYGRDVCGLPT